MKCYAGIGSRETPNDILLLFKNIGLMLALDGYVLRSGHAPGADQAFEDGCDYERGEKEIYLPWKGFEHSDSEFIVDRVPEAFDFASKFHPVWDKLSNVAKKMHARNGLQVLGVFLNEPCDFIVCWTKGGRGEGGTGQALRIAKAYNIPIFDAGWYRHNVDDILAAFKDFYKKYGRR